MGQNFIQTGGGSGGGSGTVNSGTAGQMTYYAGTGTTVSGTANATISSGALTLGVATSVQGQVLLSGATSGAVTVTGAAAAGTWTLTLPTTGGTNGYFLQTNGSGTTTWAAAGAAAVGIATSASPSNNPGSTGTNGPGYITAYTTALSLTSTAFSGNFPVMVIAVLNISANTAGIQINVGAQLYRASTAIGSVFYGQTSGQGGFAGSAGQVVCMFVDTPTSGSYVYSVKWGCYESSDATPSTSTMSAYEIH